MIEFFKEFFEFLKENRKFWLIPIILIIISTSLLFLFASHPAVAPFIYTIF